MRGTSIAKLMVCFLNGTMLLATSLMVNAAEIEDGGIIIEDSIVEEAYLDKAVDAGEIVIDIDTEENIEAETVAESSEEETENIVTDIDGLIEEVVCVTENSQYLAADQTMDTGDLSVDEFTYGFLDDGFIEITGYTGSNTTIAIPDKIDGYTVIGIAEEAFLNNEDLECVTIPDGVASIGVAAFRGCINLVTINIPSEVTEIKDLTFYECEGLKEIMLPDGLKSIGSRAFQGSGLTNIVFPESLESIGQLAFHVCFGLGDVYIPRSVTDLDEQAFYNCSAVVYISADSAAANCLAYQDTGNVISGAFRSPSEPEYEIHKVKCADGSYYLTVGDYFGRGASIRLPSEIDGISVKKVEGYAFQRASQLKEVYIPDGYTGIKYLAFYTNKDLAKVYVPDTVIEINQAFDYKPILQCYSGSYTENWAKESGCPVELVDGIDDVLLTHTIVIDAELPASCTEGGKTEGSHCSVCGRVIKEQTEIPVKEHIWDIGKITLEPTCTEEGEKTYICTLGCNTTKTEKVATNGHAWNTEYTIDKWETCGVNGSKSIRCSSCNAIKEGSEEEIPATQNHAWNTEYTIDKEPTYSETGSKSIHCEFCTAIKADSVEEIPILEPEIVSIDETNFPDPSFREYIKNNIDTNGNGYLNAKEIAAVLTLEQESVADLTGIKYFSNLRSLIIYFDTPETLDVSNMPNLSYLETGYGLKYLDISGCERLETLDCSGGDLEELNLMGNINLTSLNCSGNFLTELDLSNNKKLQYINCGYNELTELELDGCSELKSINCERNSITYLDLSNQFRLSGSNNITGQMSTAGVIKTENGWLVNMKTVVGTGNINTVNLQNGWVMQENGYVYYEGSVCPQTLYYSCNTNCPVAYLNLTVELKLVQENCNHDYVESIIASTCTKKGERKLVCSVCEAIKAGSEEEIPCIAHPWNISVTVTKEATCTATGFQNIQCSVCKAVKEGSEKTIPKKEHNWDKGKETKKASCESAGEKTYTCTVCKETKKESSGKASHKYASWKKIEDATVFRAELQQRECSECGNAELKFAGDKLKPMMEVNVSKVLLKTKQTSSAVKVTKMAKGDEITSWKSSNTKIFKVSKAGKLTAGEKAGKATLTITLKSGLKKEVPVTVQKNAVKTTAITGLSKKLTVQKGKKYTLKPVIEPITSVQKVTYTSSNKKIATVSAKGVITAKKAGTVKITVKSGSKKYTVTVTVPKTKTTKITGVKEKVTVKKGKTYKLNAVLAPKNSDETITYKSSNKKVATVDKKGKIKGIKKGTATITVTSGKISVKCKVTVIK